MSNTAEATAVQDSKLERLEGKYITFHLDGEEYGIPILNVREIIGMMKVTPVPRTPEFVRGVVNLRGKVIPVIDLRTRFGLEFKESDDRTPIIVVEIEGAETIVQIGIVVDAVSEVIQVTGEDIEETPSFGVDVDTKFILGMAKVAEGIKTLLDINKVLTSEDLVVLEATAEQ
ncbi:MAG: chemotaxis protein CheW [Candidatus Marinimicrobia bacterium]|nr:chemotaxis protein CheW [Candidatus Neomarinimicrobiota bacterium]MCF7880480.1 chemotaxis protein CheW [Candidatus Neomarinimicrobiota bacterium]